MAYQDEVLTDSPTFYWRLNETTGATTADDATANNRDGTINGSPTLGIASPVVGSTGMELDGTNDYLSRADEAALDFGDVFSFECWLRRDQTERSEYIFTKGANAPLIWFDISGGSGPNHNRVTLTKRTIDTVAQSTVDFPTDGLLHHLVVTKNGSAVKIWIDRVDRTGTITNQTMDNTTIALEVGGSGLTANRFLDGAIDEVALYSTALSQARVQAHYDAASPIVQRRSALQAVPRAAVI